MFESSGKLELPYSLEQVRKKRRSFALFTPRLPFPGSFHFTSDVRRDSESDHRSASEQLSTRNSALVSAEYETINLCILYSLALQPANTQLGHPVRSPKDGP